MFASYYGQSRPTAPVSSRRTVFANAMVAHVWAQRTNSSGRSSNGNFYFEGDTIYSYGSHFPIARFVEGEFEGKQLVLFNPESRSVSTSGHQRYVQDALRGLPVKVFAVPHVRGTWGGDVEHERNVKHLVETFSDYAARLAKAHVKNWQTDRNAEWDDLDPAGIEAARIEAVLARQSAVIEYCNAFGVECPNLGTTEKCGAIRAAFSRYYAPKAVAKRADAAAKRGSRHWTIASQVAAFFEGVTDAKPNVHFLSYDAKRTIASALGQSSYGLASAIDWEHAARVRAARGEKLPRKVTADEWLAGEGEALFNPNGETLVRRKGNELQTSRGATCPFSHAVVAFLKAQQCRTLCRAWHTNGEQVRVGVFKVDAIDEAGNLTAGCHTILWQHMLALALREVPHMVKACFPVPALS